MTVQKPKGIFLNIKKEGDVPRVFDQKAKEELSLRMEMPPEVITPADFSAYAPFLRETEYIFSTWGMYRPTEEELTAYFPRLKAVFYAAGTVKGFAGPFLERGIRVFSAVDANAVPVSEFVFAEILLANKGVWAFSHLPFFERGKVGNAFPGNYGATVGLIGMGRIGRLVAKRLQTVNLKVLAYDPYLSKEEAADFGVEKVSLEAIFERADVISNHLPDIPELFGVLNGKLFEKMKASATFLNTGRGREVVEADLIEALRKVPTRTAVLDVTFPEPPEENSPLYGMENVILTPHIAGSSGNEVRRMAEYMIAEFDRLQRGEPLLFEIDTATLKRQA